MHTAAENLRFTSIEQEDVPVHAFYDGLYLGSVAASTSGWIADCRGIDLGRFATRAVAMEAVLQWVRGLDIEEWPAIRNVHLATAAQNISTE
jgi:hypothetical protein